MATPFRELIKAELAKRPDLKLAELGQRIGAKRSPPAAPRAVEKTLYACLAAHPKYAGGPPREMGERLFGEICDELGLEIKLVPR